MASTYEELHDRVTRIIADINSSITTTRVILRILVTLTIINIGVALFNGVTFIILIPIIALALFSINKRVIENNNKIKLNDIKRLIYTKQITAGDNGNYQLLIKLLDDQLQKLK